ncbi:MAG: A/G-specific adenine glycosylase, partial [Prochlorococcaceae cyanobacterium]
MANDPIAERAPALRLALLEWWEREGRQGIPWKLRPEGRRPAAGEPLCALRTWVAEVMLQQTQLAVMLPYWHRWMGALPDLEALATADPQTLLRLWQGLGYYS